MSGVGHPLGVAIRALENRIVVRIRVTNRTHSIGSISPVTYCEPGVVEHRSAPCRCVVASGARGCENSRRSAMHRVRRGIVIRFVAAVASRREADVVVIYMATGAGHLGVKASQRERRHRTVIKFAVGPSRGVVAELASRGESYLDVVNRGGSGVVCS